MWSHFQSGYGFVLYVFYRIYDGGNIYHLHLDSGLLRRRGGASSRLENTVTYILPFPRYFSAHSLSSAKYSLRYLQQVHKIPGTAYANSVALPASATEPPDSFKARMERLKDKSSTNLYMEGLPLSIDPPTLQALIAPYKIMSSRLFQTRLSNPPRIIAFVRCVFTLCPHSVFIHADHLLWLGWIADKPRKRLSNACTGGWFAECTMPAAGSPSGSLTPLSNGNFAYVVESHRVHRTGLTYVAS